MKIRELGNCGFQVSEIGLGSWLTYAGGLDREVALAVFAIVRLSATDRQRRVA